MGETSNSSSQAISPATKPKNLLDTIVELPPENTKDGQGETAASNGGKETTGEASSNISQFSPSLYSESGDPLPFLTTEETNVDLEVENPFPGLERGGSGHTENEGFKPSLRKQKK
ncbi:hypothetical protein U1Q18_023016 [Sarracenia purpurea var. burkii]